MGRYRIRKPAPQPARNRLLSFTVRREVGSMAAMLGEGVARRAWSFGPFDNVRNTKDVKWQAESS
jgi:hypothetical protein